MVALILFCHCWVPEGKRRWRSPMGDAGNEDIGLWLCLSESLDKGQIVAHEVVAVVGPGAWVSVVDAQMNDDVIGAEGQGFLELLLLHVGQIAFAEQRGAGLAEVAHDIVRTEQALQLGGIGIGCTAGYANAIGDTVSYAGHFDGVMGQKTDAADGKQ